jgi:hypothetical protein
MKRTLLPLACNEGAAVGRLRRHDAEKSSPTGRLAANSSDYFSTDVPLDVSTLFAGSDVQPPGWAALPEEPAIWQMDHAHPAGADILIISFPEDKITRGGL